MFSTLFFMASIMLEIYCFLELREDIISVICGGGVVLIAGYLFIDTLPFDVMREKEIYYGKSLEYEEKISKEITEILKFQKALYVLNKKAKTMDPDMIKLMENLIKKDQ